MHTMLMTLAILTASLMSAGSARADDAAEREAVLAAVQATFDVIASGDPSGFNDVMIQDGVTIAVRPGPDGGSALRVSSNAAFIAAWPDSDAAFLERFTEEPIVHIHGPIAVVWGAYEFLVDGERSHCGVDAIDLVKVEGVWKVANIMWTVEREECGA